MKYSERFKKDPKNHVARICVGCGAAFVTHACVVAKGLGIYCTHDCYAKHQIKTLKHSRARGGKRQDLGGKYFRSRWEANWARYLEWMKGRGEIIGWEFEPETFEFPKIKRGARFYTPDFRVTKRDSSTEYHEVKGWMDPKSKTKLKRMAKYHPLIKIVLIEKPLYDSVRVNLWRIIPGWEHGESARA